MMKKIIIFTICIVLVAAFGLLVYYGLTHSRGMPTSIEKGQRVVLDVPFIEDEVNLTGDAKWRVWATIAPKEVKLVYQLMVLPWPKQVTPLISVKAFHNKKDIYFYVSWKDETEDRQHGMNRFSDACAVLFPLGKDVQPSTLMMGFMGRANIWHWKASADREYWRREAPETDAYADFYYPFEEEELFPVSKSAPKSAVNDLLAIRVGTITPKETQNVEGRGFWEDGSWRAAFKRSIEPADLDNDAVFKIGEKKLCAFAVWNGSKGDRGGRKSISDWVELDIR